MTLKDKIAGGALYIGGAISLAGIGTSVYSNYRNYNNLSV